MQKETKFNNTFLGSTCSTNANGNQITQGYGDSESTSTNPVHRARYPETNNHLEEEPKGYYRTSY